MNAQLVFLSPIGSGARLVATSNWLNAIAVEWFGAWAMTTRPGCIPGDTEEASFQVPTAVDCSLMFTLECLICWVGAVSPQFPPHFYNEDGC